MSIIEMEDKRPLLIDDIDKRAALVSSKNPNPRFVFIRNFLLFVKENIKNILF